MYTYLSICSSSRGAGGGRGGGKKHGAAMWPAVDLDDRLRLVSRWLVLRPGIRVGFLIYYHLLLR